MKQSERSAVKVKHFERISNAQLLMLISIVIFFAMYIIGYNTLGQGFRSAKTPFDILNAKAPLIIIACSLTVVMIGGGINISVGGVLGLTAMSCALLMNKYQYGDSPWGVILALLLALGLGLAFGLVQGALISYLDIQPFIVTLAGMVLARGLLNMQYSNSLRVNNAAFTELRKNSAIEVKALSYLNSKNKLIIPKLELGVIIAIAVVILVFLMLRYTKKGRHIYAIGGNQQSALMLGINVKNTRFFSYVISGLLSGLAGFIYLMHEPSANTTSVGIRGEMDAIASSIIGGTLLTGGVGNVIGTFFGVMILALIERIIWDLGLQDSWWQDMTSGAMLGLFIIIQSVVLYVRGKPRLKLHTAKKLKKPLTSIRE
ncbi:MAG: sugar ABC transporter permease YjfF [Clostridia bacterium]|nr:sugar ABC transporter permease YjfF [Clostridia bacterium]MBR5985695.1 sugar ABC transporter permease YjfF [Clostridia bacterium]MBR6008741.1 sugar ABC transporter permease YjfF [Clostridia bacterium]MBR6498294.1 sugar ABC transporter permease YjfF [Clostridia bacterium]